MSKARELAELSRTVSDSADAVAITIDASENVTFANDITVTGALTLGSTAITATGTELNYVDGVTSAIQTQLDAKAPLASPTFAGIVSVGGITGSADGTLKVKSNSNHLALALEENSGNEAYQLGVVANGSLIFANSGTEVVRFDDSGHVGIGITPPAQDFGKYLTVNTANLIGNGASGGYVGTNQYYDGAWKYQVAAGSALISFQNDGDVTIRQAASGSANGTITYSENFVLDAAGHLGLGTSSPTATYRASIKGDYSSIIGGIEFDSGGGDKFTVGHASATSPSATLNVVGAGNMIFKTNNQEAYRITAARDMYFGSNSGNQADVGHLMQANGVMFHTAAGSAPLRVRRNTSDGPIAEFQINASLIGVIAGHNGDLHVGTGACGVRFLDGDPSISPYNPTSGANADNSISLGRSNVRYTVVYATTGSINTSDRDLKQDIEELSEAEKRVAVAAKGLLRKYRWKDAVAEKGDDARIHFGIIAQDLQAAFEAEGLDAARYGMWCSDTWTNDDGSEQTRLGVRYSELLAFIIAAI